MNHDDNGSHDYFNWKPKNHFQKGEVWQKDGACNFDQQVDDKTLKKGKCRDQEMSKTLMWSLC